MDFSFSEEHEVFRRDLVNFLEEVLPDDWNTLDVESPYSPSNLRFTKEMATTLSEKGWLTMAWPEEYGGQGRSIMEQLIYREEMSYHSVPGSDLGTGAISWVGPTLMIAGTDQQKKEHLPPIAKAERYWCTLYSEPGSGSDLASLQTSAIRDGDDFVVNGSKIWTSSAHIADWGWLAARTDPAAPKHKGVSLFMLDMKSRGVTIKPIYNMADGHDFNEVFFEDVRIPAANLVGEQNQGWYTLAVALDFERSGVGYSANCRKMLEAISDYAKAEKRNGKALSEDPLIRNRLAERWIETEVSRWLSYRVAWMQSQGMVPNYEASMSKVYGTELTQRVANTAMKVIGMNGTLSHESERSPLAGAVQKMYLSSVSSTIAAGTSEIQRNIIAGRGLGLPRG